jgi:C4-dicarboxylate-specific signal transduction histidine kinase
MRTGKQNQLLEELQRLLNEQNNLARQGKLRRVQALCERTGSLIGELSRSGILESAEFAPQRRQLADMYENLRLILSDQRDQAAKELDRIRKGRKTIRVYRDSIQAARE